MTDGYQSFARFYDGLMEDARYDERCDQIIALSKLFSHELGRTLDLCCGTGCLTRELKKRGVDVFGCDGSVDMLSEAVSNGGDLNILYICQDMRELELGEEIDTCVCTMDSLNHLTDGNDLLKTFESVGAYLRRGGLFIFDVNTPYKHRVILGNNDFVLENDEVLCAWRNNLLENDIVEINLDFFVNEGEHYTRLCESFTERAYSGDELRSLLARAGFSVKGIYGDLSLEPPKDDEQRVVFVAEKL